MDLDLEIPRRTLKDFAKDQCPRMAAAISYYVLFSLPPLLMLVFMITGFFVDSAIVEQRIEVVTADVVGSAGASQIREIIRAADRPGSGSVLVTILSIGALLFGATGIFVELRKALNQLWEVRPNPTRGSALRFITGRLLSLGMVVIVAVLLLVSSLLGIALSAFAEHMPPGWVSTDLSVAALYAFEESISLVVTTSLFMLLFMMLPDARSDWRDVWVGALATALLFSAGKLAVGFYVSKLDPGEAFGAAGSLAVILLWVYYSSMILYLGAEFTRVLASKRGRGIQPKEGAVRVSADG